MDDSVSSPRYLHGFSQWEQNRLFRQARFFEKEVYDGVDFKSAQKIIEVGSGVGAQTEILLERFPKTKIQCVDFSDKQIERAKHHLQKNNLISRVHFHQGDATKMPFSSNEFDGAFLCWFLEHVENPIQVLNETKRVLKPGSPIFLTEILNATYYVHPYSPATLKYWFEFNDHQWTSKGDPFVGAKLANYLMETGYKNVKTNVSVYHLDNRNPKDRAAHLEDWTQLLLSAAPKLLSAKRVTQADVDEMQSEMEKVAKTEGSVFFYTFVKASATA
jgi:ubiquinone/menaquinone biosynthesis C-methylase UbiE